MFFDMTVQLDLQYNLLLATVFGGGQEGSSGVLLQSTLEIGGLTGRSVCIGGGGGGGFPSVEGG